MPVDPSRRGTREPNQCHAPETRWMHSRDNPKASSSLLKNTTRSASVPDRAKHANTFGSEPGTRLSMANSRAVFENDALATKFALGFELDSISGSRTERLGLDPNWPNWAGRHSLLPAPPPPHLKERNFSVSDLVAAATPPPAPGGGQLWA